MQQPKCMRTHYISPVCRMREKKPPLTRNCRTNVFMTFDVCLTAVHYTYVALKKEAFSILAVTIEHALQHASMLKLDAFQHNTNFSQVTHFAHGMYIHVC